MKFKLNYIFFFVFLFSCVQDMNKIKKNSNVIETIFSSKGFALVYNDTFYENAVISNKLNNEQNYVLHTHLKNDRLVNIINPLNSKSIIAKVKNATKYPSIYNIVITKKMSENLNLDANNPYVEILTIKKNDKFIAKEASIFAEEKNVANKAPVTSIDINDLSISKSKTNISKKINPSYIIHIADFYYLESAEKVKNRFKNEGNLLDIVIKQLSKNKFKVYFGPYDTFSSMKDTYLILNELGFDELNVVNINK